MEVFVGYQYEPVVIFPLHNIRPLYRLSIMQHTL